MNRLEQAEVCQTCGRPYLVASGHNCPGPRSSLYLLCEETPMTRTYTRTASEYGTGRTVTRVQEVITSPGRVVVRKYRNGQSQPAYGEDIPTRFPAFTAWRVGMTLRRDDYRRTALPPETKAARRDLTAAGPPPETRANRN